jgi:hypothetical protein
LDRLPPMSNSSRFSCHPDDMIALTDLRRKGDHGGCRHRPARNCSPHASYIQSHLPVQTVTSSLAGIIMPPHFCQSTALLNCENRTLRWPGPFDTGFLSPQPPGVAGIGSIAEQIIPTGPTRVGPFSFLSTLRAAVRLWWRPKTPRQSRRSKPHPAIHLTIDKCRHMSVTEPPSSHN